MTADPAAHPPLPPSSADDELLSFGRFTLSVRQRLLREAGHGVHVGARAMDVLLVLARHPGRLLDRRELAQLAWPGAAVEDNSLRVHIAALRKLLGDGAQPERYIENVPGRGYRFVAQVRRGNVRTGPAPGAAPPPCAPPPRTAQVFGRDDAIAGIAGRLQRDRLLTIVGPGGIGKTTVALAVAHAAAPRFPHGVCFVDLGALADEEAVLPAVAATLGVLSLGANPMAALCAAVRDRRMLVVLDNCEHVAEAAALVAERLVGSAPDLCVLATSREPLSLQSETVHRLAPLDVPAPGDRLSAGGALAHAAVRLFAVRAAADAGGFELADDTVDSTVLLCHRLDGNPLAIELAAARVGSLGVEGLARGVGNLFDVLTRGWRTAEPRHQTLHAMLDWSYRLLAPAERTVFARLSVFRSSFPLDSATDICGCARIDAAQVQDAVTSLGLKSMLMVEAGAGMPRYRLLNTTRAYAALRCAELGESATIAARHAHGMLRLVGRADTDLQTMAAADWHAAYAGSVDDYLAALDWAFGADGDPRLGIDLAATGWMAMIELRRWDELSRRTATALAVLRERRIDHPSAELQLLSARLAIAAYTNDDDGGAALLDRMQVLMDRLDSPARSLDALHAMFGRAFGRGDFAMAKEVALRVVAAARALDDPVVTLMADRFQAVALHYLGDHAPAARYAERALRSPVRQRNTRFLGYVPRAVTMRLVQARIAWLQGCPGRATAITAEALRHAEGEHPFAMCQTLAMAAIPIAWWSGERQLAARYCERLADLASTYSMRYWFGWVAGYRHVQCGGAGLAADAAAPAHEPMLADMLGTMGYLPAVQAAYQRVRAGKVGWCAPEILRARGEAMLAGRAPDRRAAERLFGEATQAARHGGAIAWELRSALSLARLWTAGGRAADAQRMLTDILVRFPEDAATGDVRAARAALRGQGVEHE